jgi:hypothetical protein
MPQILSNGIEEWNLGNTASKFTEVQKHSRVSQDEIQKPSTWIFLKRGSQLLRKDRGCRWEFSDPS